MQTTFNLLPFSAYFIYNNAMYRKMSFDHASDLTVATVANDFKANDFKSVATLLKYPDSTYVNDYRSVGTISKDAIVEMCSDCVVHDYNYDDGVTFDYVHLDEEGLVHNDNGPAVYRNNFETMTYYKHGVMHREDGPAHIVTYFGIDEIGEEVVPRMQYWVNGVPCVPQEYKVELHKHRVQEYEISLHNYREVKREQVKAEYVASLMSMK